MAQPESLNPAQLEVLELLGATPEERPSFDPNLRVELKTDLEIALSYLAEVIPEDDILFVGKRQLAQVMGCEAKYLAELEGDFEWSIPLARGTLAHKAIELSVHWRGDKNPIELTEQTLAKVEFDEAPLGRWLQSLTEADRAELQGEVSGRVTAFLECWPPLKREWRPAMESPARVEIAQGKIVLAGKVDLALGRASGNVAGKVLVDLKTGRFSPIHRDDLRYYALLEAIRIGTPPRLVATYYLDQARFTPEPVSIAMLHSTIARVVDAIHRMVELRYQDHQPTKTPGPPCNWCPALDTCAEGQAHLANDAELHESGVAITVGEE